MKNDVFSTIIINSLDFQKNQLSDDNAFYDLESGLDGLSRLSFYVPSKKISSALVKELQKLEITEQHYSELKEKFNFDKLDNYKDHLDVDFYEGDYKFPFPHYKINFGI